MRVHHLNCGTLCPYGERLIHGAGSLFRPGKLVCHCLLIETEAGLVLVDTGFGLEDIADARSRLGSAFMTVIRPRLLAAETAAHQVERLGFRREDVRHIILTHLDLDHAGGIADFPSATVHLHAPEHAAAMAPTPRERPRYRAVQWAHGPRWALHEPTGEPWFGFECARDLPGLPPEILLVPLLGHTRGHAGIAVDVGGSWLLHAGDAYFHRAEIHPEDGACPASLLGFQSLVQVDKVQRLHNQRRLRELAREHGDVRITCAHDPVELACLVRASEPEAAALG